MKEESLKKIFFPQKETLIAFFKQFGFNIVVGKINKHTIDLTFRNDDLYVKIFGSRHPYDYPYFVNLIVGKGDFEHQSYEKTGVPIWKIKRRMNNSTDDTEYPFNLIYENKLAAKIESDMLDFAFKFLEEGDTSILN